jgi:hypothetical protein
MYMLTCINIRIYKFYTHIRICIFAYVRAHMHTRLRAIYVIWEFLLNLNWILKIMLLYSHISLSVKKVGDLQSVVNIKSRIEYRKKHLFLNDAYQPAHLAGVTRNLSWRPKLLFCSEIFAVLSEICLDSLRKGKWPSLVTLMCGPVETRSAYLWVQVIFIT